MKQNRDNLIKNILKSTSLDRKDKMSIIDIILDKYNESKKGKK